MNEHQCAGCCYCCQFTTVFLASFLRRMAALIVSHLPQNNSLFRQLGILVMWLESLKKREAMNCFHSQLHITSGIMFLKISSAVHLCILGFPYMVNVFAAVQTLSLGAPECLCLMLLYGFEFRTSTALMFDLG